MLVGLALTLLNVGLVAAPIGGAVGTLAGIDYYRRTHGQSPLFTSDPDDTSGTPGYTGGGGGGGEPDNFNYTANYTWPGSLPNATTTSGGVTLAKYCQQYVDIDVGTKTGQNYTLNPNQWGWTFGDEGGMCLNVTTFTNMTYATNTTAPDWSVTWQYDAGPSSQPVHAFPNIMMDNSVLPVKLSKLSIMSLDVQWAYEDLGTAVYKRNRVQEDMVFNVDEAAIEARAVKQMMNLAERYVAGTTFSANVAVDMFFDSNAKIAGKTSNATYEVMVWLAQFGQYTDPIGSNKGAVTSYVIDGANFTLYSGTNNNKQHVLTWVAEKAAPLFSGSLLPLIEVLPQLDLDYYPGENDYLGYFAFGSECYYSADNITFYVQDLSMEIR
ncbi:xyloglucan-specific endoglucanase [Ophiostoma piceae UAMH 11346]|uniref:Xyloglucan-specific endoglucanase n=1 Tax=Ophiostoma piceae (strain UAMH 11346) TaxID=1262450 RepID=S3BX95_OPHP1|nr:xyloglucan-specific endoglucanase [Ophiostoma piceae UAMH 11346]